MSGVVEATHASYQFPWLGARCRKNIPILTARSAVEVDDNLQAMVARPCDGLLEVGELAGAVRLAGACFERPVPDRDADVVKPISIASAHHLGLCATFSKATRHATHPASLICLKSSSVI